MSLLANDAQRVGEGFPRVSGDEPDKAVKAGLWGQFSPRERG